MAVVATLSKGYDLEYIWKQVDRGPAKDAASYYIQASETGGEPPGRWWGPGASALGLEPGQVVDREPYDLLFGERKAPDGTQLGRPPADGRKAADLYSQLLAAEPHATAERKRELRTEAVRKARQSPLFFDLTLSLSKSISIFHASLGENARLARQAGDHEGDAYWTSLVTEVDDMIWQAVRVGFGYFQREAGYTRTGSHNTRVRGRETGQWHEADLAVAHWLQHTSRDGDMQLHVHSQIVHVAKTGIDGKWRAPDSLGYNEHIGVVGAVVSQYLEEALTGRFGLEWTARDDGHGFEIKGISGEMIRLFSSRRASITADLRTRAARFEQRYGRAPSQREMAQLAQASNFKTRAAKEQALGFEELHKGWADKLARTVGVSLASVAPSVWHHGTGRAAAQPRGAGGPALTGLELSRAAQKAVALAQQEKSDWTRADVIKYLGRVLPWDDGQCLLRYALGFRQRGCFACMSIERHQNHRKTRHGAGPVRIVGWHGRHRDLSRLPGDDEGVVIPGALVVAVRRDAQAGEDRATVRMVGRRFRHCLLGCPDGLLEGCGITSAHVLQMKGAGKRSPGDGQERVAARQGRRRYPSRLYCLRERGAVVRQLDA